MSRSGGSTGLVEGLIELALAIGLFLALLYLGYWVWVNYWPWIVAGAAVIGGMVLFVHWLRSRGGW